MGLVLGAALAFLQLLLAPESLGVCSRLLGDADLQLSIPDLQPAHPGFGLWE